MTPETFAKLKKGDVVRHKLASQAMTVHGVLPNGSVMLVRHATASNPIEWLLIGDDGWPVYDEPEPG